MKTAIHIDDQGGSGWEKVTIGKGSPTWGHSSVPVAQVLELTP